MTYYYPYVDIPDMERYTCTNTERARVQIRLCLNVRSVTDAIVITTLCGRRRARCLPNTHSLGSAFVKKSRAVGDMENCPKKIRTEHEKMAAWNVLCNLIFSMLHFMKTVFCFTRRSVWSILLLHRPRL